MSYVQCHASIVCGGFAVIHVLSAAVLLHLGCVMSQVFHGMFFACCACGRVVFVSSVQSVTHASCVSDVLVDLIFGVVGCAVHGV